VGDIYRDVYIDRNPVDDLNSSTGCTGAANYSRSDCLRRAPGLSDTKTIIINGGLSEAQHQIWVYVDARCQIDE